jgi:hypothetical protein
VWGSIAIGRVRIRCGRRDWGCPCQADEAVAACRKRFARGEFGEEQEDVLDAVRRNRAVQGSREVAWLGTETPDFDGQVDACLDPIVTEQQLERTGVFDHCSDVDGVETIDPHTEVRVFGLEDVVEDFVVLTEDAEHYDRWPTDVDVMLVGVHSRNRFYVSIGEEATVDVVFPAAACLKGGQTARCDCVYNHFLEVSRDGSMYGSRVHHRNDLAFKEICRRAQSQ